MDENIKAIYQNLFNTFGVSPEAVKSRNSAQQEMRFYQLLSVSGLNEEDSILDIGCGSGEFLTYLRGLNYKGDYCGVDFIKNFIDHNIKKFKHDSNASFLEKNIIVDEFESNYDWVFLSGVFNDIRDDSDNFFFKIINKMYKSAKKGIAFNSLSKYVDYEDESLYYTYPDKTLKYCIENLSKYTILKTNYQTKENTIPFEYSISVFKK